MTKVFELTIVQGKPELYILSYAPGTSRDLIVRNFDSLETLAKNRGAHIILLTDCDVRVPPVGWWLRLKRWLRRKENLAPG